jgi:hypothetical protein
LFLDRLTEKLNVFFDDLERSIRNRVEQFSIALAMIFPNDGW